MSEDARDFLSRWSRRKTEARQAEAEPKPADAPAAPVGAEARREAETTVPAGSSGGAAAASPSLPPLDSLNGVASDYREFLKPEVDESLRRGALKQLFSDPHFNVMDGLDTYIDDYSKEDPIPDVMLKALNHAQGLIFDREDQPAEADPQVAASAAGEPAAEASESQEEAEQEIAPKPSPAG